MKKIVFLLTLAFVAFTAQAKDILPENVPANVRSYVTKNYPKAGYVEWELKNRGEYYEAEFEIDRREVDLKIASDGKAFYIKEDIDAKDVPDFAKKYVEKNYDKATLLGGHKKIENGKTTYSVGFRFLNSQGYERHRNIVFDDKGNLIKR